MKSLSSIEVTEPGIYTWVDALGISRVGQIRIDQLNRRHGTFITPCGNLKTVVFAAPGECLGTFYGPMTLASADVLPSDANILAASVKKHRDSSISYAAMGNPEKPGACAEAIARTFARFAGVDEKTFLTACGLDDQSEPDATQRTTTPGGCGVTKI